MKPPLPKYELVRALLQARLQRELSPGFRLPSELELARSFGVSRMTIQQALSLLEKAGIVRRQQGRGTFYVGESIKTQVTLSGVLASVSGHPEIAYARVLSKGVVAAPPHVADRLRIPSHSQVVSVERVGVLDNEPILLILAWLPYTIGSRLLHDDEALSQQRTLVSILEEKYGVRVRTVLQTVTSTLADPAFAPHLGIEPGAPLLEVERTYLDAKKTPVNFSIALYRCDRYRFDVPLSSSR